MIFSEELLRAKILNFYGRYVVDVLLDDGSIVVAFCPDNNTAKTFYKIGEYLYISKTSDPSRKIKYDVQLVCKDTGLIYVNPVDNLKLFAEAFEAGVLADSFGEYNKINLLDDYAKCPYEAAELSNNFGKKAHVYVVSIYDKVDGFAVFPPPLSFFDFSILENQERLKNDNIETYIFMIIPRKDCAEVKFSWKLSPASSAKVFDAAKKGINFVGYSCFIDKKSVKIADMLKIIC